MLVHLILIHLGWTWDPAVDHSATTQANTLSVKQKDLQALALLGKYV